MVQPYNYAIQTPSAFESLVSGLKLGTSLQEMQTQQQLREAQAEQIQQKMEAERQRQTLLQDFYSKAKSDQPLTSEDWLRFGEASNSENYRKLAAERVQSIPEEKQREYAGWMGQTTVALWKTPKIGLQRVRDRLAANPTDKGLQTILEMAEIDPKAAAVGMYGMGAELGQNFKDVFKNVADALGMKATTENWKPLSAAELKNMGWKEDTQAVKDSVTGNIRAVGSSGTNVKIENEGSIPPGYRAVRDSGGKIIEMRPIPGSPAANEAQKVAEAAEARASGKERTASVVTKNIDSLIGAIEKEEKATGVDRFNPSVRITGIPGKAFEGMPGGARITAKGYIDTIKANIGFDRLDQMRQESPTGGALGQIAVEEIRFLQSSLGSLDLDADPAVLKKNLQDIKKTYDNVMRKAAAYPNAAKYGFGTGAEPAAGGAAATPPDAGRRPSLESIFSR